MPTNVIMPALELAQESGKVLHWLKFPGDTVTKGEPLVEIETDKVTTEIEAPASGALGDVTARDGDVVPVGQTIALIFAPDEARSVGQAPAVAPPPRPGGDAAVTASAATVKASPLAREIAREHGVDLAQVTAAGGKIEKADVLAHIASRKDPTAVDGTPSRLTAASPKARRRRPSGVSNPGAPGSGPGGAVLRRYRRHGAPRGAEHARAEAPGVGTVWRIMVSA
jgi:pyruvate dehydrogenase E2 component (dihydrolipoamide acetyltransferase)